MAEEIQYYFQDQHDEVQNTWLCYNQIQTSLKHWWEVLRAIKAK